MAAMTPLQYLPVAVLLLAAKPTFTAAELSGDNLCHKRETYTVTMRVVVKEPVKVKSYTWCLNVPPRCTKYKIEMRDKYKIQTEIRERVVDVCCPGYAPDRSETLCIPVCRSCLHGVCVSPDICYCEPGYIGDHCDAECQNGFWGSACVKHCECQNGATCNHVTGDCKCGLGWRGNLCDVPCPKGTYGHACLKECDCPLSSRTGRNLTCHHVTGECTSSEDFPAVPSDDESPTEVHPTTAVPELHPITTIKTTASGLDEEPIGDQDTSKNAEDEINKSKEFATDMPLESKADGETTVILQTTKTSVSPTDIVPLPSTQKHIISVDGLLTTLAPENTNTTLSTISTTAAAATILTTNRPTVTVPTTVTPIMTDEVKHQQMPDDINNSIMDPSSSEEHRTEESESDSEEISVKNYPQEHAEDEEEMVQEEEEEEDEEQNEDKGKEEDVGYKTTNTEQTTEEIPTTEPQNIQLHPRGVIVVSDGLLSERTEEDGGEESKSGVWNLVSSVTVAGGVALALIVMAAVTLVVSHRRNRAKIEAAESEATNFRRQQEQKRQQQTPGPQMYTYTEDVPTLPLRNLFPDATYQPDNNPCPNGLQLRFGDVTSSAATNNNLGPSYHDMRAYLELQYDIPPSSISSKTNSLLPGMEPEHLYDEIPCWRSNATTSTNTDTDTTATTPC